MTGACWIRNSFHPDTLGCHIGNLVGKEEIARAWRITITWALGTRFEILYRRATLQKLDFQWWIYGSVPALHQGMYSLDLTSGGSDRDYPARLPT